MALGSYIQRGYESGGADGGTNDKMMCAGPWGGVGCRLDTGKLRRLQRNGEFLAAARNQYGGHCASPEALTAQEDEEKLSS